MPKMRKKKSNPETYEIECDKHGMYDSIYEDLYFTPCPKCIEERRRTHPEDVCPRCGEPTLGMPALSRSHEVDVCGPCGGEEAALWSAASLGHRVRARRKLLPTWKEPKDWRDAVENAMRRN